MSRTLSIRTIVEFYYRASRRYPRLLVATLVAVPISAIVNNVLPALIVGNVLTRLSRHDFAAHHVWSSFHASILAYVVVMLLGGVVTWRVVDICAWRLEAEVERDLARESFGALIEESSDFHANTFGGSLVSNTSKLLSSYIRIADTLWFETLPLLTSLLAIVIVMAPRSLTFALLLAGFAVVYMLVTGYISAPVRRAGAAHAATESVQTGALADSVTNVMAIKSFAREGFERERFGDVTTTTRASLLRMMRAQQKATASFGGITSAISIVSLIVGIYGVVGLDANIGTVYLIVNYTASVVQQLFSFSNHGLRTYNRAFGDASDMIEILRTTPEIIDPESPEPVRIRRGDIRFSAVTFAHKGAASPLFDGFDLHIAPGERIGLVGHSGSGKTSLTKVLQRFADIAAGEISIDGQSISAITQADLHDSIAYVPQEPLLFHRSIMENIAYGKLGCTEEQVYLAARQANATEFIATLPMGFDTLVGERGVKLSGGQRQRIAIARAMIKNAPVLILDEATSALDSESEVLIQKALWSLMEGRTAIVIAHRLSTIQKMDRIVVLDGGRIVEMGTHGELLRNREGTYATFWAHQSDSFIEA